MSVEGASVRPREVHSSAGLPGLQRHAAARADQLPFESCLGFTQAKLASGGFVLCRVLLGQGEWC